jgi:hypothetical protein
MIHRPLSMTQNTPDGVHLLSMAGTTISGCPPPGPESREARAAYIEPIRQKIASVPHVSAVAVGIGATPPDADVQSSFIIDGSGDGEQPQAHVMLVDQRYFATLHPAAARPRVECG